MKFNRIVLTIGLAAVAIFAAPLTANALTPPNYNYIGIGGSDEGFTVNGKINLHDNLSVRPAIITDFNFDDSDDVSYIVPLTYDFNAFGGQGRLFPWLGAGVNGDIGADSNVDFAVTGGADYRINEQFLVNGSVVWSPFQEGDDEVGFLAGIGYSF